MVGFMQIDEIVESCYEPSEYPAQSFLMQEWSCTRPFDGLNVLVATPIFRNTLVQYQTLIAGGANLYVGRAGNSGSGTSMPCDLAIVEILRGERIPVVSPQKVLEAEAKGEFMDLILDCAGQFCMCHPKIGFVELTRSGVQFYENAQKPVYVADCGIVKRIETCLGTGDGYFRALAQLGHDALECKKLMVFGSGKVGCGIALQGVQRGLHVTTVTDVSREGESSDFIHTLKKNDVNVVDCRDAERVAMLIENTDFVVTATGVKNALAVQKITDALLSTKAILANMGVEDEYGQGVPPKKVLAEKSPLNFILEEPTHLKYIDASMALHASLAERLVLERDGLVSADSLETGPRNPPQELEQRLLSITLQDGIVGPEICGMLGLSSDVE